MKIGIGYDIHRFADERKLFLGGVEIPYVKGLIGWSDGDVLMHAIADAMLGALGLGDIGHYFPNNDPKYRGISSAALVSKVSAMVAEKGYRVGNIDSVVIAEEPKIYPYREKMAAAIAKAAGAAEDSVSIKATTNEGVGSLGKGEAVAAYAVVLLEKKG